MATMVEITCKCGCNRKKSVREADVKRGWGKFFSKSCKAKHQEKRTGQYANYKQRSEWNSLEDDDQSWDAHKSYSI